jgi:MoaA/NifB/PqqE/SkfB family radical SAM enzyme
MSCTGATRVVQVHPTRRCNLRCLHCYSSSGPEERGGLAVGLLCSALADAAAEGYTAMAVSGGEPLLYRPLPELLGAARRLGMVTALTTNGMLLDERRLASLAGALDLLVISLDGIPASHDRMRNDPRAFATMAGRLPGLRQAGLPFGFLFTLTQHNLHELDWVAAFAVEQGARLLQIHPLEPAGRAGEILAEECPDDEEGSWAFLVAAELQQRYGDRLRVHLDFVSRRAIAGRAGQFFAGAEPSAAEPRRECASSAPGGTAAAGATDAGATDADADAGIGPPLSALVQPLVIEADGEVVPLEYGFPRHLSLGNLHDAPLPALAERWRRERQPAFRRLCRAAFAAVVEAPRTAAPLTSWGEALRRADEGLRCAP